jgi:energy-coupling factor transporter ATP-binding protein EcfA2
MFSNRPLFATRSDARYYVERPVSRPFVDALHRGQNVLLIGERGSGKTTLLHMAERELREDQRQAACFVSLAQIDDIGHAIAAIYRAAADQRWLQEPNHELIAAAVAPDDPFAPTQLLQDLGRASPGGRLLIDDIEATTGHALFGRLRDELWQLPVVWAVAVDESQASDLLHPPADAFFERRLTLPRLARQERADLLDRRNAYGIDSLSASQIDKLAAEGPGNPRQLISFARQIAEEGSGLTASELIMGAERRRERAEAVAGRAAGMLVTEMEGLGPVSASDERLLERLGWTRPRAAGLLGELEDHGVVASSLERRDGRAGRPRKLYELRPPSDFIMRR